MKPAVRPCVLFVLAVLSAGTLSGGAAITVSPTNGPYFSGLPGGPFTPIPSNVVFSVANMSSTSNADFNIVNPIWVDVTPMSGSISPSGSTTVSVTPNAHANTLLSGSVYSNKITFHSGVSGGPVVAAPYVYLRVLGLSDTPSSNFTSFGQSGGPFSPSSFVYTITNETLGLLNWSVGLQGASTWASLSATTGGLAGLSSTNITVSINATANSLPLGVFWDTILLSNASESTQIDLHYVALQIGFGFFDDFSTYTNGNIVGQNAWYNPTMGFNDDPYQIVDGVLILPGGPGALCPGDTSLEEPAKSVAASAVTNAGAIMYLGMSMTVTSAFPTPATWDFAFLPVSFSNVGTLIANNKARSSVADVGGGHYKWYTHCNGFDALVPGSVSRNYGQHYNVYIVGDVLNTNCWVFVDPADRFNIFNNTFDTHDGPDVPGWAGVATGGIGAVDIDHFCSASTQAGYLIYRIAMSTNYTDVYNFLVSVNPQAPVITTQPQGQTVVAGGNITLSVAATGTFPRYYQWQMDGHPIAGATNSTLTMSFVTTANAGGYSVVVSNSAGSVTSAVAQLTISTPITVLQTNRSPTTAETTPTVVPPSPSSTQLVTFVSGFFATNAPDPTRMTIVLTHGLWDNPNGWGTNMAALIVGGLVPPQPNIVAWDWSSVASSKDPTVPAKQTGDQGRALGQALQAALGPTYSRPIHFIGHSLGTLVNAAAANYLHGEAWAGEPVSPTPWSYANTQMTLFDDAEIDVSKSGIISDFMQVLTDSGDFLTPKTFYYHPLPKHCAWADNYMTAFGLAHPEAANAILTNDFPASGQSFSALLSAIVAFHGYPMLWYKETILTDASAMGWVWSFEREGFGPPAPATNTVFMQSGSSPWNLTQTSWGVATNYLDGRIQGYHNLLLSAPKASAVQAWNGVATGVGDVTGELVQIGKNDFNAVINFATSPFNIPIAQVAGPYALDALSGTTSNVPAYAWIQVLIPSNAVAMSFDFKLQGDGSDDSFIAALNGTNILSLAANMIETNLLMNSGQIDVSALAGQTTELFFGIIGGTSTNVQMTVQDILFYTLQTNQVDSVGDGILDSWRAQYFPTFDPTGATTDNLSCATCDADGTGQNNFFKYTAGLDPTNPAAVFVLNIAGVPNQPQWQNLFFSPVVGGRTYSPQFRTNLVGGVWLPLTTYTGLLTNSHQVTITDTNPIPPQEFYRIDISVP